MNICSFCNNNFFCSIKPAFFTTKLHGIIQNVENKLLSLIYSPRSFKEGYNILKIKYLDEIFKQTKKYNNIAL